MGTGSYVVMGKGESQSWQSCSHGAGRKMSRTKAFSSISQGEFEKLMRDVVCDSVPAVKDEAPQVLNIALKKIVNFFIFLKMSI